jgi:prepilin-type N-terminal cleavage/methylation domain-containing protein/prepilin-type processing-associated H-X9-DG protein
MCDSSETLNNSTQYNAMKLRSSHTAFTLIELLTVIAIITILAAILIPVTGKVRESAQASTCLNNLRQIGTAIGLYQSEHQGGFPPAVEDWFNAVDKGIWFMQLEPYGAPFKSTQDLGEMRNQDWWYCPACRDYQGQKAWAQPDYGANKNIFVVRATIDGSPSGAASGISLKKPINIINTAQTIAVMETGGEGNPFFNDTAGSIDTANFVNQPLPQSASDHKNGGIAFRHPPSSGATCNTLFADLHVESVSRDDVRLQTVEGRGKMMSISE